MTSSALKSIFLRKSFKQQVEEIHEAIVANKKEDLTLIESLLQPVSRIVAFTDTEIKAGINLLQQSTKPTFKSLGTYNMTEIGNLESRWEFVQAMMADPKMQKVLNNPTVKSYDLNTATEYSKAPNVLLAIKYFYLIKRLDPHKFYGSHAITSPVDLACEVLFGKKSLKSNLGEATRLHTNLAKELNKDELYVNTALWLIGTKIQEKTK